MHEQELACVSQIGREVADTVEDLLRGDTGADEPLAPLAVRESTQATAGRCDQLENSLVVGLEQVGLVVSPERRLKTDAGDVDPVAVEIACDAAQALQLALALTRRPGLETFAHASTHRVTDERVAEARGFVLGGALAAAIGAGFILARKPGKLPRNTASVEYQLEYGVDALEVHADALRSGARVLVHDDLMATGGTARALCDLVEGAGARVAGCAFVIELAFLCGRERLAPHDVHSLITYESP